MKVSYDWFSTKLPLEEGSEIGAGQEASPNIPDCVEIEKICKYLTKVMGRDADNPDDFRPELEVDEGVKPAAEHPSLRAAIRQRPSVQPANCTTPETVR